MNIDEALKAASDAAWNAMMIAAREGEGNSATGKYRIQWLAARQAWLALDKVTA